MTRVSSSDSPRRSVSFSSIVVCARSMFHRRAAPGAGRRSSGCRTPAAEPEPTGLAGFPLRPPIGTSVSVMAATPNR